MKDTISDGTTGQQQKEGDHDIWTKQGNQVIAKHRINTMHLRADSKFECIRDDVQPIELETVSKDKHVHDVERSIRTIKEQARMTIHGLPYIEDTQEQLSRSLLDTAYKT